MVLLITLTALTLSCFSVECEANANCDVAPRIVGGTNAELNEFPFQVHIFSDKPFCGGTILNENYVLTSANCVIYNAGNMQESSSNLTVVAGGLNWRSVDENDQKRRIQQIFIHENYNASSFANDIAIVQVTPPFTFNEAVRPARLPNANPAVKKTVIATGWYLWYPKRYFGSVQPSILQKVELSIVSNAECAEAYRMAKNVRITDNMICAGNLGVGGRGSCHGDAGGPLTAKAEGNESFAVVGISSFGVRCGHAKYPGVYTKVSKYVDWITSIAGPGP